MENKKTLNQVSIGSEVTVDSLSAVDTLLRKKLLSLGFIKGEKIRVVSIAPLGDPINIEIKGYNLSLRKSEAKSVILEN